MDKLISAKNKRQILQGLIKKGLMKTEDLDTPTEGWYLTMGYEKDANGKWFLLSRTKAGAPPSMPLEKLPRWKNPLTGKITFDPVEDSQYYDV